jgi:PRTRC genetic system protein E
MDFFQQLAKLEITELKITVVADENGTMTVFIPTQTKHVKDSAVKALKPLFITNTPQELDKTFFDSIATPLKNVNNFIDNIKESEAKLEEQRLFFLQN